jgi:hypothetical protein
VAYLVRLTIHADSNKQREVHLRLPDRPQVDEIIELPDHTRVAVLTVEPGNESSIDAIVTATPTDWEPSRISGAPPETPGTA